VLLSTPGVVPEPATATFHGRDLFAPVGAWLAGGGRPEALGPVVEDPVRLPWPSAERVGEEIRGNGLLVDSFGNVVTSIRAGDLEGARVRDVVAGGRHLPFVRTFGDLPHGGAAALVGSWGRLEVVVREGHAARSLSLDRGSPVVVRLAR
jgi:hypothetical protein